MQRKEQKMKEELKRLIEEQQEGHEGDARYMLGEQLKDIAAREPLSAELLLRDLTVPEMSLAALEKKLQELADRKRERGKNKNVVCVTPKEADTLIRDFYGLGAAEEMRSGEAYYGDGSASGTGDGAMQFVDLGDFL